STLVFVGGTSAAALLLNGLYGINKNQATPSWCLCACAITATFWLILHLGVDGSEPNPWTQLLVGAGENVFLAYLISEMLPSLIECTGLSGWYSALAGPYLFNAIARSAVCALVVLGATVGLNRLGFRLRL